MNADQIREMLKQYATHGWNLRRVLLSAETRENLTAALESLFGDAPVAPSEIDAVWFSRPAANDGEAWELRRLSQTPFALIEVFDADDDEDAREDARQEMEKVVSAKR